MVFRFICAFGAVGFVFNGISVVPIVWAASPVDGFGTAVAFGYSAYVLALYALVAIE